MLHVHSPPYCAESRVLACEQARTPFSSVFACAVQGTAYRQNPVKLVHVDKTHKHPAFHACMGCAGPPVLACRHAETPFLPLLQLLCRVLHVDQSSRWEDMLGDANAFAYPSVCKHDA
eukprot:1157619-Pelagomonas_calceolata.AAC.5